MTTPQTYPPEWNLPLVPPPGTRGGALTAPIFARLLAAAHEGGWPLVWTTWAQGDTTTEPAGNGQPRERPARRRTLSTHLGKRPDLKALLEEAAQERRDRIVSQAEDAIVKLALGKPDITRDFDKNGNVTRERIDSRNKLRALEQVLKAEDRDKYGDHKRVEHAGTLDHRHAHVHAQLGDTNGYIVNFEALQRLPEEEQRDLLQLLEKVEQHRIEIRKEQANEQGRPLITSEPVVVEGEGESAAD